MGGIHNTAAGWYIFAMSYAMSVGSYIYSYKIRIDDYNVIHYIDDYMQVYIDSNSAIGTPQHWDPLVSAAAVAGDDSCLQAPWGSCPQGPCLGGVAAAAAAAAGLAWS